MWAFIKFTRYYNYVDASYSWIDFQCVAVSLLIRVQLSHVRTVAWCAHMAGIVAGKVRKAREKDAKESDGGVGKGIKLVGNCQGVL